MSGQLEFEMNCSRQNQINCNHSYYLSTISFYPTIALLDLAVRPYQNYDNLLLIKISNLILQHYMIFVQIIAPLLHKYFINIAIYNIKNYLTYQLSPILKILESHQNIPILLQSHIQILLFQYQMDKVEKKRTQIQTYLKQRVNPILEPLTVAIIKSRPENILDFCVNWIKNFNQKTTNQDHDLVQSDEENDTVEQIVFQKKRRSMVKRNRSAVSAEVYGEFNKQSAFVPKVIPKSQDTKTRILILLRNNILFKFLDQKNTDIVIDAMDETTFQKGDQVIKEGQGGDLLYMVEEGEFDCFKNIKGQETFIKTYTTGDAFGELALLYNAPRAASIVAKTEGKLFVLDRNTFSAIMKESASKKRQLFENSLKKVQLLDSIDPYERSQICDALKECSYNPGEYVIRQDDIGDKFYIVVEGKLVAERKSISSSDVQTVYNYKQGDYFGEIALVRNIPRQASVKALTPVRIVSIQRNAFKRILGPIQDILKRNEDRYQKFWSAPIEAVN